MRYIIGIDLGTTNSCVSYVDTQTPALSIQQFRIPQLTSEGCSEALPTLPSFCYLTASHEWPKEALNLPWKKETEYFAGAFAQAQGSKVPTRLVQSAKSWLCHAGANRREKILPFEAADESQRISPIEASARYLRHIKEAWNHSIAQGDPEQEFEQQEIILTVPASFDEVARTLTAEAAALAGLVNLTLLEEPQAAFYSWLSQHESSWQKTLPSGSCVLVCDVGGGTTDFSLIEVKGHAERATLQRMSVGDHLLLGGDNMDAALAHYLEQILQAGELSSMHWMQLRHAARSAKEALLSPGSVPDKPYRLVLQGTGSSVIKNSLAMDVNYEPILKLLLDGFFGQYEWNEALKLRKTSGFRTMGLPYEDEPSITKHMAHFLLASADDDKAPKKPDFVLFNGGAMKPKVFQDAILASLRRWFPDKTPHVLPSCSLDLAVARGAAYYGKVRRGMGIRIGGGTARGYYLAIDVKGPKGEHTQKALTLLPRGSEEGSTYEPDRTFLLQPNTPVSFHMFTSHVRLHDTQGDMIDIDPIELQALPPIHTLLRYGKQQAAGTQKEKVPVHLGISLTAIGTIELWLKSQITEHRWSLEFQLRTAAGQDNSLAALAGARTDETFDNTYIQNAQNAISEFFSGAKQIKSARIMEHLEELLNRPRREWSPSILRGLWEPLLQQAGRRKVSAEFEARWWNLAGFLLRPGFGYPLDDFRLKELWKIILGDMKSPKPLESQIQTWICYRRIAGGLNKGQQMQLANEILPAVLNKKNGRLETKGKGELYQYNEKIRSLAALELIDMSYKIRLGEALIGRLSAGEGISADYWALARIGSRHLFYGSIANVVPKDLCSQWVDRLLTLKNVDHEQLAFIIGQLARKTSQRELNLPQAIIDKSVNAFGAYPYGERLTKLLTEGVHLTESERDQVFGDKLPVGLTLVEEFGSP